MKEEVFYFHSGLIKVKGKKKPFRATAAGIVEHVGPGARVLHIGVSECAPDDTFLKQIGRNKAHGRALSTGDRHSRLKGVGMAANILLSPDSDPRKVFNDRAVQIFKSLGKIYWFKTDLKHKTYAEVQLEELVESNKIIQFARAEKEKMRISHFKAAKALEERTAAAEFDPDEFKVEEKNVFLTVDPMNHSPEY